MLVGTTEMAASLAQRLKEVGDAGARNKEFNSGDLPARDDGLGLHKPHHGGTGYNNTWRAKAATLLRARRPHVNSRAHIHGIRESPLGRDNNRREARAGGLSDGRPGHKFTLGDWVGDQHPLVGQVGRAQVVARCGFEPHAAQDEVVGIHTLPRGKSLTRNIHVDALVCGRHDGEHSPHRAHNKKHSHQKPGVDDDRLGAARDRRL